jgi:AbrB family looped-hinge helix DNA binding protein
MIASIPQLEKKLAIELDEYGRVLIPKSVRSRLNLSKGSTLRLTVKGNEIVLSPVDLEVEERVSRLSEYLTKNAPKAFVGQTTENDAKWMSRSWALKKLGL